MKKSSHGANLFELQKKYNFNINEIADFSSNINPLGPSKKALEYLKENLELISTYPDPEYRDLKASIANYTLVNEENILLGNGVTELLKEYINFLNPKKSIILSPTYSEYESELRNNNSEIFYHILKRENSFKIEIDNLISTINTNNIELFILCNPNNPTGTILKTYEIEYILKNTNCKVLIDETYIEFTDMKKYSSAILTTKYKNLFVVRGTSKFFATPGIRLGYGISSSVDLKNYFENDFMLWEINILADLLGSFMFDDREFIETTFDFIQSQKDYMISELKKINSIEIFESFGNFVLCKIKTEKTAKDLRESIIKNALVIRDCSSFKYLDSSYFRFCILNKEQNQKLIDAIKNFKF